MLWSYTNDGNVLDNIYWVPKLYLVLLLFICKNDIQRVSSPQPNPIGP